MFTKTLSALLVATTLVGCAGGGGGPLPVLSRANTTQQDFAQDDFACKQIARATAPGGGFAMGGLAFVLIASAVRAANTTNERQQVYSECMAARGYTVGGAS